MDAAPPSLPEEPPARDWSLLPLDALSSVFVRLTSFDVLTGAGLVCRSWLEAAKVPDLWRVVDMTNTEISVLKDKNVFVMGAMAKAAVDRSGGQLRVFAGKLFVTEELLQYIVERSPSLTTLRLVSCYGYVFSARLASFISKSPLRELRSLELENVDLTVGELTAVLENFPVLEDLTVWYCEGMWGQDQKVLRAKFARIKTLTFDCGDDEFEW